MRRQETIAMIARRHRGWTLRRRSETLAIMKRNRLALAGAGSRFAGSLGPRYFTSGHTSFALS
eukprot:811695-Pyramimonas_sp.AAC.1